MYGNYSSNHATPLGIYKEAVHDQRHLEKSLILTSKIELMNQRTTE